MRPGGGLAVGDGTSFHLAYTKLKQVDRAGGTIWERLDLLEEEYGDVYAKFQKKFTDEDWKDQEKRRKIESILEELENSIQQLRDSYEQILDTSQYTTTKRNDFRKIMFETSLRLKVLIAVYDLLGREDYAAVKLKGPSLEGGGR